MGIKHKLYNKMTQFLIYSIPKLPVITTIVLAYLKAHDKVNYSILTILLPVIIPAGIGLLIVIIAVIYLIINRKKINIKGNGILSNNGGPNA